MKLDTKDFARRLKTDDFLYRSFEEPGDSRVCWLASLAGAEVARDLFCNNYPVLHRIPRWADFSPCEERKKHGAMVLRIMRRQHSKDDLQKIEDTLRELWETTVREHGIVPEFEGAHHALDEIEVAFLYAAEVVSAAIAKQARA